MMMSIDRIEDGVATIICLDDAKRATTQMSAEKLPQGAREGDVLQINNDGACFIDIEATNRIKKQNQELFESLLMP